MTSARRIAVFWAGQKLVVIQYPKEEDAANKSDALTFFQKGWKYQYYANQVQPQIS